MSKNNEIQFNAGSYVFLEGDEKVKTVYIVKSGEIALSRSNKKLKGIRTSAKSGDIIGFISVSINRPRVESAVTIKSSADIQFDLG